MKFPITPEEAAYLQNRQRERDSARIELQIAQRCLELSEKAMGEFLLVLAQSHGAASKERFTNFSVDREGIETMLTLVPVETGDTPLTDQELERMEMNTRAQ